MHAARALAPRPTRLGGLATIALIAAAVLAATIPPPAAVAGRTVRLEAGPQTGVRFDSRWHVVSRRTVILDVPATVGGGTRTTKPAGGTWLKVTSGALAGRWVRESTVAYVPGYAGSRLLDPPRTVVLSAGRWERYRFDDAGRMLEAAGATLAAPLTLRVDRSAVVRGQRHVRIASGAWDGWWLPGSVASPVPIGCTAGSPPAPASPVVLRSRSTQAGEIALTFDMGGRLTPALSIVRALELARVCATIFPTGDAARTATGAAVLAEVAAHPELFELGNHTVHHCNLRDGGEGAACPATRPDEAFAAAELRSADTIIATLAGRHTTPYWRPPYGAVDGALREVAAGAGYPVTVLWSIDTIDWRNVVDGGPTAADSAAKVIGGRSPGGVVLMHLGGWRTRDALPAMIAGLRAAGYTPTSVSALFRAGR